MSTAEEVREKPIDPLELVDAFKNAHSDLLDGALNAYNEPSDEALLAVSNQAEICRDMIKPFGQYMFFREADNPLYMNAALTAVIEATAELVERAKILYPTGAIPDTFVEGIQPYIEFCLTGDETIELSDEIKRRVEADEQLSAESAANTACSVYLSHVENLENALANSDNVSMYIFVRDVQETKHEQRINQAKQIGSLLAVGIVSGVVANFINGRKA